MSLRKNLKTSPKLETDGVTLQIDNTRVLLARAGGANQAYNAKMLAWYRSNKRAIDIDQLPEGKVRREFIEFYADTIVLNWETGFKVGEVEPIPAEVPDEDGFVWRVGIENEDGTGVIPFNRENVIAYFNDVPEWFNECKQFAEKAGNYRQSLIEGIAGN